MHSFKLHFFYNLYGYNNAIIMKLHSGPLGMNLADMLAPFSEGFLSYTQPHHASDGRQQHVCYCGVVLRTTMFSYR